MGNRKKGLLCVISLLCISGVVYFASHSGAFDAEKEILSEQHNALKTGSIRNFAEEKGGNRWSLNFDYMDGNASDTFFMEENKELLVRSSLGTGDMRLAITQGSLLFSPVEILYLSGKNFECQYDLTNWKRGPLTVWVIGDKAERASVEVQLVP